MDHIKNSKKLDSLHIKSHTLKSWSLNIFLQFFVRIPKYSAIFGFLRVVIAYPFHIFIFHITNITIHIPLPLQSVAYLSKYPWCHLNSTYLHCKYMPYLTNTPFLLCFLWTMALPSLPSMLPPIPTFIMSILCQNPMNVRLVGLSIFSKPYLFHVKNSILSYILLPHIRLSRINALHSQCQSSCVWKSWSVFPDFLTEKQFLQYFRMSMILSQHFINDVSSMILPHRFKSEEYLCDYWFTLYRWIHQLTIALQILGGASYLDVLLFFEVSFNHAHKIFNDVVTNWLQNLVFYPIDGIKYCSNMMKWMSWHCNSAVPHVVLLMVVLEHRMDG